MEIVISDLQPVDDCPGQKVQQVQLAVVPSEPLSPGMEGQKKYRLVSGCKAHQNYSIWLHVYKYTASSVRAATK